MSEKSKIARTIIGPIAAFAYGAFFSLFPYVYLQINDQLVTTYNISRIGPENFVYLLTFFIFFLTGALASQAITNCSTASTFVASKTRVRSILFIIIVLCSYQIYTIYKMFGFIPILQFGADFNIQDLHEVLNEKSSGQIGTLQLLLRAILYLIMILGYLTGRLKTIDRALIILSIILLITGEVLLGKRQGVVIDIFVAIAFINYTSHKSVASFAAQFLTFKAITMTLLMISIFGFISLLRNFQSDEFFLSRGLNEIARYLCYPFMNSLKVYDAQLNFQQAHDITGFFQHLLPYAMKGESSITLKVYEPTIGFNLHTSALFLLGIWGACWFYFALGFSCSFLYALARQFLFARLLYGYVFWALTGTHTYNHIISLNYFIVPLCVAILISLIIKSRKIS